MRSSARVSPRPRKPNHPNLRKIPYGLLFQNTRQIERRSRKTAVVLNTDVRTLFIPGRQIDEAALAEWEAKFLQADMGVKNVQRMIGEMRENWRMGKSNT